MRFVFLHGPRLGPLTWRAVAEDQGDFCRTPALRQALVEPARG